MRRYQLRSINCRSKYGNTLHYPSLLHCLRILEKAFSRLASCYVYRQRCVLYLSYLVIRKAYTSCLRYHLFLAAVRFSSRVLPPCLRLKHSTTPPHISFSLPYLVHYAALTQRRSLVRLPQPHRGSDRCYSCPTQALYVESRCYLGNQTQLQLRGPQRWKEQVAGKQSI
jgi:hypothetical protein